MNNKWNVVSTKWFHLRASHPFHRPNPSQLMILLQLQEIVSIQSKCAIAIIVANCLANKFINPATDAGYKSMIIDNYDAYRQHNRHHIRMINCCEWCIVRRPGAGICFFFSNGKNLFRIIIIHYINCNNERNRPRRMTTT